MICPVPTHTGHRDSRRRIASHRRALSSSLRRKGAADVEGNKKQQQQQAITPPPTPTPPPLALALALALALEESSPSTKTRAHPPFVPCFAHEPKKNEEKFKAFPPPPLTSYLTPSSHARSKDARAPPATSVNLSQPRSRLFPVYLPIHFLFTAEPRLLCSTKRS